jgi:hypothetical protein
VPGEEGHHVRIEAGEEESRWVEKDAAPGEEGRRARGFFVGGRGAAAPGEVGRGDGARSAATSPRPAAAPRHEVRGERRGRWEMVWLRLMAGDAGDYRAVPVAICGSGGRKKWGRRRICRGDGGGGGGSGREDEAAAAGGGPIGRVGLGFLGGGWAPVI